MNTIFGPAVSDLIGVELVTIVQSYGFGDLKSCDDNSDMLFNNSSSNSNLYPYGEAVDTNLKKLMMLSCLYERFKGINASFTKGNSEYAIVRGVDGCQMVVRSARVFFVLLNCI